MADVLQIPIAPTSTQPGIQTRANSQSQLKMTARSYTSSTNLMDVYTEKMNVLQRELEERQGSEKELFKKTEMQQARIMALLSKEDNLTHELSVERQQVKEQSKTIQQLSGQNSQLQIEVRRLKAQIDGKLQWYQQKLDEAQFESAQLRGQLQQKTEENGHREAELLGEIKALQDGAQQQKLLVQEMQSKFDADGKQRSQQVFKLNNTHNTEMDRLCQELSAKEQQIITQTARIQQLEQQKTELQTNYDLLVDQQRKINREFDATAKRLAQDYDRLSTRLKGVETTGAQSAQSDMLDNSNQNVLLLIQQNERNTELMKQQLCERDKTIADFIAARAVMEQEIERLQHALVTAQKTLKMRQCKNPQESTQGQLSSVLTHQQGQLELQKQTIAQLTTTNLEVSEKALALRAEIEGLQKELAEAKKVAGANDLLQAKKQLDVQNKQIAELKKQLFRFQLLRSGDISPEQLFMQREAEELRRPNILNPTQAARHWGKSAK